MNCLCFFYFKMTVSSPFSVITQLIGSGINSQTAVKFRNNVQATDPTKNSWAKLKRNRLLQKCFGPEKCVNALFE